MRHYFPSPALALGAAGAVGAGWAWPGAGVEGWVGWWAVPPGAGGAGDPVQGDAGPTLVLVTCMCEHTDMYISAPSSSDGPWALLPSLCLGTELSNPRTPASCLGNK